MYIQETPQYMVTCTLLAVYASVGTSIGSLDITLCLGSTWCFSVVSETALYGTSRTQFSLHYHLCFWRQNYAFPKVSLKTHVFSANVSLH